MTPLTPMKLSETAAANFRAILADSAMLREFAKSDEAAKIKSDDAAKMVATTEQKAEAALKTLAEHRSK